MKLFLIIFIKITVNGLFFTRLLYIIKFTLKKINKKIVIIIIIIII